MTGLCLFSDYLAYFLVLTSLGTCFASLLWQIWKRKNSIIFTATDIPNESGPADFCTINTDGVVNPQSTFGSIGGLLRSHYGEWIVGSNKSVDFSSPLQAELWGIYEGLCLAWTYGFEKVVIQMDCSEAYKL
ncbi:hypothetical protein V6N12_066641 [Hibiscus sabdariffa]|uniref:RNase H type-1 domain-containing protein n=1 Tax=Hibiscus sabdariffa TaxID=183260 RepID=A0ABR2CQP4_9ROSI